MLDLFPVELRAPVWYVLAGFILGFAVSTLWEWLHFRRYRVETTTLTSTRIAASNTRNSAGNPNTTPTPILQESAEFEPAAQARAYRSPTVFSSGSRTQTTTEAAPLRTEPAKTSSEHPLTMRSAPPATQTTQPTVEQITNTAIVPFSSATQPDDNESIPAQAKRTSLETAAATDKDSPHQTIPAPINNSPPINNEVSNEESNTVAAALMGKKPEISRVARSLGYPDELTKIRGIGETYKRRLFAANIFTFHHIATSDIEVLRRATQAAPNAKVESWPAQAEALAQKNQRLNASYSGPLPDDLQEIAGVGPYFAQMLYRSGICTFEQMADASVEELRAILPPSVLGREVDLAGLIQAAQEKAVMRKG